MTAAAAHADPFELAERKINIIQGEHRITDDPDVVLTTLLGSCVAACLRDPVAGVGGMNHFLLPGEAGHEGMRYGVHAMELLTNALLKRGARRERLEAKLFGGARLSEHLTDVGGANADFAERFLRAEGVRIVGASLRGGRARRIQFWPVSGRARQILLSRSEDQVFAAERLPAFARPPAAGRRRRPGALLMPSIPRTLEHTLRMAAIELAELAAVAYHLEQGAAVFAGKLDDALIERCQLADQLTQRLAGLTAFVAALAERAPPGVWLDVGDAAGELTLADQARRLTGAPCAVARAPSRGEVVLFD